jgi:hypothetical protein
MNCGSHIITGLEKCLRLRDKMWFFLFGLNLGFPSDDHIFLTPGILIILEL